MDASRFRYRTSMTWRRFVAEKVQRFNHEVGEYIDQTDVTFPGLGQAGLGPIVQPEPREIKLVSLEGYLFATSGMRIWQFSGGHWTETPLRSHGEQEQENVQAVITSLEATLDQNEQPDAKA